MDKQPILDNVVKMSVTTFERYIANTFDHVWYGVLKTEMWNKKYTLKEWFDVLAKLKAR